MKLSKVKRSFFFICLGIIVLSLITQVQSQQQVGQSTVAIVQSSKANASDVQEADIRQMVREAVELAGGLNDIVHNGDTVVIKPNLVTTDTGLMGTGTLPDELNGVTTDWRVTKVVVELVREINPNGIVYIMEGSATPTRPVMEYLHYNSSYIPGVDEFIVIEEDSGGWLEKDPSKVVVINPPDRLFFLDNEGYWLNKKYYDADVIISLPTLKNHWHAVITGGIKNVSIGCSPANIYGNTASNPNRMNWIDHTSETLHMWIHDFFMCKPVNFVIMDGLQGVQNGPNPQYPLTIEASQKNMRLILASSDPVAIDTIEGLIMEWDPASALYLNYLNASGAGNINTNFITVLGKKVADIRTRFEGVVPDAGGAMIYDTTPPFLTVNSFSYQNYQINLTLNTGGDTTKVEVYVDDTLYETALAPNLNNITSNVGDISSGSHKIDIYAYDKYLNHSLETVYYPQANPTPVPTVPGNYNALKTDEAMTIDGMANESCWASAPWAPLEYVWFDAQNQGTPQPDDFSGQYKIVWDQNMLYYFIEITDNAYYPNTGSATERYWEYDCPEVFLDENNNKDDEHQYDFDAFAYHIDEDGNFVDMGTDRVAKTFDHGAVRRTQSGNTHYWEISLKVFDDTYDEYSTNNQPVVLNDGKVMGFAVGYNDNDNNYNREHLIGSIEINEAEKNIAYIYTRVFGDLTLMGGGTDPTPTPEIPTPTPIQILTPTPTPTINNLLGDVNNDSNINIVDALLVAQYYVGLISFEDLNLNNADTDCNGSVNIVDALLIAQYYVGLITGFCL